MLGSNSAAQRYHVYRAHAATLPAGSYPSREAWKLACAAATQQAAKLSRIPNGWAAPIWMARAQEAHRKANGG